ncbi:hypothetical protein CAOG_09032 [Capsaspora owczarzaki ATCC 30864]|uniref:AB hydrolase-1 domain-containing protein n=1 Tax=Capsaspora owczarzaki (strain ATCC 30864) TaxID=595528 RepID=A0A0D2UP69_CAPO3|nr:hypothetical protein CAOG_09032 [Capsaspora owczarzaki ATCC 30864]KJE96791.1 hypothetical protein CAOG_009032 [Capsaspora owczarzaki ATCC 30864]|eukprot:XP_011270720.1 hypothetical protein CAOG_09032 [Capsaspora owczarzaki ATCC 30864]
MSMLADFGWVVLASGTAIVATALLMARIATHRTPPTLHHHPESRLARTLRNNMKTLSRQFLPTWWALNGHAQTVFGVILRTNPDVAYERELVGMSDGGQVALDWHDIPDMEESTPLVVVLHGLTGGSNENYVKHIVLEAERNKWRTVVFNNRGCGNSVAITPRGFSATFTDDIAEVVQHVHAKHPKAPLFAVGVSLGSMILIKYLAERGTSTALQAAVAVSNPWDIIGSTKSLESFPSLYLYNQRLAKNLKNLIFRHRHLFDAAPEKWFTIEDVEKCRTIRDFDQTVVVPMFGFASLQEYYSQASSVNHLPKVQIPLLCINAADDPFSPVQGIPFAAFEANPNALLCLTPTGGHIGFSESHLPPFGSSFVESALGEFLHCMLAHQKAA